LTLAELGPGCIPGQLEQAYTPRGERTAVLIIDMQQDFCDPDALTTLLAVNSNDL
jgi:isochorismate hydrolase